MGVIFDHKTLNFVNSVHSDNWDFVKVVEDPVP